MKQRRKRPRLKSPLSSAIQAVIKVRAFGVGRSRFWGDARLEGMTTGRGGLLIPAAAGVGRFRGGGGCGTRLFTRKTLVSVPRIGFGRSSPVAKLC